MAHFKPYSLFKRGKVWYCQFRLPDGSRSVPKTTGETAKGRAESWAIDYLQTGHGQIVKKEKITLEEFSKGFFSWDGAWAMDKRVRGMRISRRHCLEREDLLHNHILPFFGARRLTAIDRALIKEFRNAMFEKNYSGSTINKCLSTLKTLLDDAEEKSLIQYVPRIDHAADKPAQKGILTRDEARRLFEADWRTPAAFRHPARDNFMGKVGNFLAITTGLRLSEIQALTLGDIHIEEGFMLIHRSWDNRLYRLNATTKTGKARTVPIRYEITKTYLRKLISENPWGDDPENFLFFGEIRDRAKDARFFTESLYHALGCIGIDEQERKRRNITFHSHRHFLNSALIDGNIPTHKIQAITGHLTDEMTKHYYHPDEMEDISSVLNGIFGAA